jgi:Tfp pilus assembly protein PilF
MRKFIICLLVLGVALSGCAKKEAVSTEEARARQLLIEGTAFLKQGDIVQAIKSFATSIKTAPNYFESYYMLGETLIRLKQFPQAVSVMSAAVRQFPNNGLAYYLLAMAHEGSQQPVAAIVAARRSVELFNVAGDKEGTQRAMILLATFVSAAKEEAEKQMAESAAKDAEKAVASTVAAPPEPEQ